MREKYIKKRWVLFIALNLLISVFYIDLWENANTTTRILPIITYFESGTFCIDKYQEITCDKSFINDHYYSDKAPLPTFIVLPIYGFFKAIGWIEMSSDGSLPKQPAYVIGTLICSVIPFIWILFLIFKRIENNSTLSPALLSMLPLYGSFVFVFAGTFFNHSISSFFVLIAYIHLKEKKYVLAGLFSGLGFLCEYTIGLVIFIWACQILWNERNLRSVITFSLAVLPSIICIMIYNYIFTGSAFTMLYKFHYQADLHTNYGFSHPTLESIWGLTFSDYRGLFFYTPFLILVLFYFIKKIKPISFKEKVNHFFSNYLFIASIAIFLLSASYFGWWGGWTYGPRLILFIAVLLLYEGILFLSGQSFSSVLFWILISFGLCSAFMAKGTYLYSLPTEELHPLPEIVVPGFLNGDMNPNNLLTLAFNISPIIAFGIWILFFVMCTIILAKAFKKTTVLPR